MARRFKKRRKFTWFPLLGTASVLPGVPGWPLSIIPADVRPSGLTFTRIVPIVPDTPLEPAEVAAEDRLVAILGDEYILERIVGHIWVAYAPDADTADPEITVYPKLVHAVAGIFVARAGDTSTQLGQQPIGASTAAELFNSYSPQAINTVREPWLWRRSWLLNSGQQSLEAGFQTVADVPFNQGSVTASNLNVSDNRLIPGMDQGTKIDTKSVRRIRQDDRLWFVFGTRALDPEITSVATPSFQEPNTVAENKAWCILDVRVLGALRKAKNTGVF